jgi:hypothetical protein
VIVSDLAAPVPGMALEIEGDAQQPIKPADAQNAEPVKG